MCIFPAVPWYPSLVILGLGCYLLLLLSLYLADKRGFFFSSSHCDESNRSLGYDCGCVLGIVYA